MIDLHCHILPGIDDGAKTLEDSLDLARAAEADGIHTIVATPHHRNGAFDNDGNAIPQLVEDLNSHIKEHEIDVTVLPGQENRLTGELVDELKQGTAIPVHKSRYVLVEFPSVQVPHYANRLFFDLQVEGYMPIIVHPERNKTFAEHPNKLYELLQAGALTQVTADSFTKKVPKKTRQCAELLLDHHMVHVIASDAHDVNRRTFDLSTAYQSIQAKRGEEEVFYLMENAERIIDNETIYPEPPQQVKKKKFLGIF
ncbi:tyrosine-protein phosphatase [Alteribacillus sp. YIM 98480]|uniref:tyrosine-protein phosphatase n=1 Tax=Alteribacillus sp. YIM 98480 TaxID=2606599 RepID=UPI00131BC3A0|nr:CpsB/CapC family capsule biosynthesis tyrosine phosphatase [Alteribacillus sp. YIM 98480]